MYFGLACFALGICIWVELCRTIVASRHESKMKAKLVLNKPRDGGEVII